MSITVPKTQRGAVHPSFGHRGSASVERRAPLASWRDLTCVRASKAYRMAESGLLEEVSNDEVRLQKLVGTSILGVIVEGARTNELTSPNAIGSGAWTANCTVASNAATAPDGAVTADRLTANGTDAETNGNVQQALGVDDRVVSVYAQRGTQGSHAWLGVSGVDGLAFSPPVGSWTRYAFALAGTADFHGIYLSTAGNTVAVVSGDNHLFWGAQSEAGLFPSTFGVDPRVAETIRLSPRFAPVELFDGPFQLLVQPFFSSAEVPDAEKHSILSSGDNTLNGLWNLHMLGDGGQVLIGNDSSGGFTGFLDFERDQVLRIRVDPKAGVISVRGCTSGDGDYSVPPWQARHPFLHGLPEQAGTLVQVGHQDGETDHFYGVISEPYPVTADGWDLFDNKAA